MDNILYAIEQGASYSVFNLVKDEENIKNAVKINHHFYIYAPYIIKNNQAFILELLLEKPTVIFYISNTYKNNYDIIKTFITRYPTFDIYKIYSNTRCSNKDLIIYLLNIDGLLLRCADNILKNDDSIVELAVKKNRLAIQYANIRFRENPIALLAVENNNKAYEFIADTL